MSGFISQAAVSSSSCPCFQTCSPLVYSMHIYIAFDQRIFCKRPRGGGEKKRLYSHLLLTATTASHQFVPSWVVILLFYHGSGCTACLSGQCRRVNGAWRSDLSPLSKMINHPLGASLDVRLVSLYHPAHQGVLTMSKGPTERGDVFKRNKKSPSFMLRLLGKLRHSENEIIWLGSSQFSSAWKADVR